MMKWKFESLEGFGITDIEECEFIEIDTFQRLYYNKRDGGFHFGLYEFIGDGKNALSIINGYAFWDGIRHLYFEECETDCTEPLLFAKVFIELRNLEERFCDLEEIGERRVL